MAGRQGAVRGPWRQDEAGHMLVLTGVLLVLGFVTLGATLVQLNSLEDKTTRSQRDPLMETVDELVAGFAESVQTGVQLGSTNITQFQQLTSGHEERLKDAATRVGLYAEVQRFHPSDIQTYLTADRCGGYDLLASQDGIIIGYEKDTLQESIVGAVYFINFTDGRQSLRMEHYVPIYDCAARDLNTFPVSISSTNGTVIGLTELRDPDDGQASVIVKEQVTGTEFQNAQIHADRVSSSQWSGSSNVEADDSLPTSHTPVVGGNHLDVAFPPTAGMAGTVTSNITVRIDAYHVAGPLENDDRLTLEAWHGGALFDSWTLPVLEATEQSYYVYPQISPSGNAAWTDTEFGATTWRLKVQTVGGYDPSHHFFVDYMRANVKYVLPERHITDIEFDWPDIPPVYGAHTMHITYRLTPGTPGEEFRIMGYNTTSSAWEVMGGPLTDTGGAFTTWSHVLHSDFYNDGTPLLRLVDANDADGLASDMDTIEIDYLTIESTFQN